MGFNTTKIEILKKKSGGLAFYYMYIKYRVYHIIPKLTRMTKKKKNTFWKKKQNKKKLIKKKYKIKKKKTLSTVKS